MLFHKGVSSRVYTLLYTLSALPITTDQTIHKFKNMGHKVLLTLLKVEQIDTFMYVYICVCVF